MAKEHLNSESNQVIVDDIVEKLVDEENVDKEP